MTSFRNSDRAYTWGRDGHNGSGIRLTGGIMPHALETEDTGADILVESALPEGRSLVSGRSVALDDLVKLADEMCKRSEGRIRLAVGESDRDMSPNPNAGHFLKFDGVRLGRDLETYAWVSGHKSPDTLEIELFEELALPLEEACPEAHEAARNMLRDFGDKVFRGETRRDWRHLLDLVG